MSDKPQQTFTPVENPVYAHPLSEPLKVGETSLKEIAIRKPNGGDMMEFGSPINADPTSYKEATINFPVAYRMASALSGIPMNALLRADPAEMLELFWGIASFFIPGWQGTLPAMQKLKGQSSEASEQPEG